MSLFANHRTRIVPNTVTYITRQLPGEGKLTVQPGQEVTPPDIIGRSSISAGFRSINIAKALSVSPQDGERYLQRPVGQIIYKGELLAQKPAQLLFSKKIVVSPSDGKIELYDKNTGDLRISFLSHQKDLAAAVYGIVEKVDNLKGQVIIKSQVTQIYGLFGSGKSREGSLKVLGDRGALFDKTLLREDVSNHIVAGGALVYNDAVAQAISKGVVGIITGGINATDWRSMSGGGLAFPNKYGTDIGIGLLVCEGFSSIPLGEDIFSCLLEFNGKFAILEGNRGRLLLPSSDTNSILKVRKVELPPADRVVATTQNEIEAREIQIGQKVRVVGTPYLGEQGNVVAIDKSATLLPSQVLVYMITLQSSRRKIKVPFTNVEVID